MSAQTHECFCSEPQTPSCSSMEELSGTALGYTSDLHPCRAGSWSTATARGERKGGSRVCAQTVFLNRHAFINKNFHLKFLPLPQRGRRRLTSAGDHELHLPRLRLSWRILPGRTDTAARFHRHREGKQLSLPPGRSYELWAPLSSD